MSYIHIFTHSVKSFYEFIRERKLRNDPHFQARMSFEKELHMRFAREYGREYKNSFVIGKIAEICATLSWLSVIVSLVMLINNYNIGQKVVSFIFLVIITSIFLLAVSVYYRRQLLIDEGLLNELRQRMQNEYNISTKQDMLRWYQSWKPFS